MHDAATTPGPDGELSEGHPRKWQILAIMCTCLVLVVAAVSSLNIAIPPIISALEPSQTEQLWIVDSYALVFAGFLLPAGAIGDRYGRKGALLAGLTIFAACAVWASYSDAPVPLITSRAVMGLGAALIMPATLSILTDVFPPHERVKAIAVWAGFAGAGGAIGVIGGGLLLEAFWWGSVFFVNVPIAAIAFALIAVVVPSSRDDEARPLDPVGSLLSIAGLSSLVYAIIEGGENGWGKGTTIAWFVAAAVLLTGWIRYELSIRHPMLDPRLFKVRPFAMGSFTITAAFAVMFGMFFLLTQYFQFTQGHTPLGAGVRTLPFALTMIIVAPRSPAVAGRFGNRGAITLGLIVQAAGFVVLALHRPDTPYPVTAIGFVLMASGMATLMPAATGAILGSLPRSKAGVGSAVNDTTREVGGALGLAVLGTIMASGYRSALGDATEGLPEPVAEAARESVGTAFRAAAQLDGAAATQLMSDAGAAFTDGMSIAFVVAAAFGLMAAGLVWVFYPAGHGATVPRVPPAAAAVSPDAVGDPAVTEAGTPAESETDGTDPARPGTTGAGGPTGIPGRPAPAVKDRLRVVVAAADVDVTSGRLWAAGALGIEEVGLGDGRVALLATVAGDRRDAAAQVIPGGEWVANPEAAGEPAAYAGVTRVGRFMVVPPWLTPPDRHGVTLVIDPGWSFGHGGHPTTRLMLDELDRLDVGGCSVDDLGCGTGVLAIAAALGGAAGVRAVDDDPDAVALARRNVAANRVADRVRVVGGDADLVDGDVDVALVNVTIDVHEQLGASVDRRAATIIAAGVLDDQLDRLVAAYPGHRPGRRSSSGHWVSLRLQ